MHLPLEHAIGQKLMLSFVGQEPAPEILATLRSQHVAGVTLFRALNVAGPAQVRALTAALQRAAAESGQPTLLIAVDQEGGQLMAIDGGATPFPGNMALGSTGSEDLAYRNGRALGLELAAMGINVNYAPACDVNSNPSNPVVGVRSFGEDPELVARLGAAMVRGLQDAGIAATAKHFPGHGDTATDSHYAIPVVQHSLDRIRQVEFPPFAAAIAAGARLVMTAHVAFPALEDGLALPATLSPAVLRGLLRGELGFEGVVISDALEMAAFSQGDMVTDTLAASAAGVDLLLLNADTAIQQKVYAGLLDAARRGLLAPDEAQAAAGRVLSLKRWAAEQTQPPLDLVGCAEHQALADEIAGRSITLVRDDAGLLPLRLSPDTRIAVVVPRTADLTPADTSSYVTCGLAAELRRYHAAVDEQVVSQNPGADEIAALRLWAAQYDAIIVGTINAAPGSGQAALVGALLATDRPVVAVGLRVPYDLLAYPQAPAYICTYGILPPSMAALARTLMGHAPFAGRLPVSLPGLYPLGHGLDEGKR